ncbi:hypothetical protein SAMN04488020_107121 [Palleronia marisminoris]|uniref:Uncharacterized protein n=1 Tax=Palleronia marisminoris TaxID=315423 RepID=A0A1Y5T3U2_9RHOB|nr:hypothetical protein [Palleronia marisminoris]SFH15218.1 hypothetical protein SAMN04488020_107121 [Palleronia marisminoris]SLN54740.1 hypothetical protein PAM7066_02594 [Palleronia marisminoris]
MNISNEVGFFVASENGAVSVDWVVLAAAGAGLAISVLATVGPFSSEAHSKRVSHVAAHTSAYNPTFP